MKQWSKKFQTFTSKNFQAKNKPNYREYNKQAPKQAESLWQSRVIKRIQKIVENHKISGVTLKEEACIDEAGVIYVDFLICMVHFNLKYLLYILFIHYIANENKQQDDVDTICELNGTHHFFSTKRIRIPSGNKPIPHNENLS